MVFCTSVQTGDNPVQSGTLVWCIMGLGSCCNNMFCIMTHTLLYTCVTICLFIPRVCLTDVRCRGHAWFLECGPAKVLIVCLYYSVCCCAMQQIYGRVELVHSITYMFNGL
jgi:hypothetical protein